MWVDGLEENTRRDPTKTNLEIVDQVQPCQYERIQNSD